ncbi:nitrous oxide reductase accessory protein NosL [Undibacterium sp.]|uniref:nitrous oxide reductase accessory protein NosL n=1 Tax=Undibacterium sp. TaxID=1914977 RepID=UPI0025F961A0|nr:nitrous oxide reductase accessory protein NosL [Undibacterium sp.]
MPHPSAALPTVAKQRFRQASWLVLTLISASLLVKLVPWQTGTQDANRLAAIGEVCIVAPPTPYDPASGIGLHAPRAVPLDARCPVCGMYPARSRDWAAQVIFNNGDAQFFDSPLTLFIYLQDVGRYSVGRRASEIVASYVSDSNVSSVTKGQWIKASEAIYVSGSTAMGPMRAGNLPAFSSKAAALAFVAQRGGKIISAKEISPQLLQSLNGARHTQTHAHAG